ncbi:MAG: HDIG domain-containing metalloprotein [Brevinematia bacterium]
MRKKTKKKSKDSSRLLSFILKKPFTIILFLTLFLTVSPIPIISHFKTLDKNNENLNRLISLQKSDINIISTTQVKIKNVMELEELKKYVPVILIKTRSVDEEISETIKFIEEVSKLQNTPISIKFLNNIPKTILTNILRKIFTQIAIVEKEKITNILKTTNVLLLLEENNKVEVKEILFYPFKSVEEIKNALNRVLGEKTIKTISEGIAEVLYNIGKQDAEFNAMYQEIETEKYVTNLKIKEKIDIPRGEVILAKGEEIDESKINLLKEYFGEINKKDFTKTLLIEVLLLSIALITTLVISSFKEVRNSPIMIINTIILLLSLYLQFYLKDIFSDEVVFLSSFLFFTVLNSLTSGRKVTFLISTYYIISFFTLISQSYLLVIYYLTLGIVIIIMSSRITRRSEFIFIALIIFITTLALYITIHYINTLGLEITRETILSSFFNSFFNVLLVLLILPIYEYWFLISTPFKLYELSSTENKLLKELLKKAPGTYYHSLNVSILAEASAEAIGADPLLAKVGALYHDIGKLEHPLYYTENIEGKTREDINIFRYVEVIKSHPKVGVEIAKKHRLPNEIQKIILEHHGKSLITYFYNKATKENPNVNIEFFRYDTPKPSTKESALIFICDKLEAKIRSIESQTNLETEKILEEVDNTLSQLILSEDLSDSNLTLKDISNLKKAIKDNFVYILHKRINYPQSNYKAA